MKIKNIKILKKFSIVVGSVVMLSFSINALAIGYGQSAIANGSSQSDAISELLASNNSTTQQSTTAALPYGAQSKTSVPMKPALTPRTATMQSQPQPQSQLQPQAPSGSSDNTLGGTHDSQTAFVNMARTIMPLSTNQIKTLRQVFDKTKRAAAQYPGTPPKPTSSSQFVDLSPGATAPVIRLQSGIISAVQFLDSTGKPWPVNAYSLGDPNNFNVQRNPSNPSLLLVQAMSSYRTGNLAVMLNHKATPIMITLLPGQTAVDYRDELRIPGLGPNASPVMSDLPDTSNQELLNVLDGVPPHGATTLQVLGARCSAWLVGNHLYLRTQLTLLSPSWVSAMSSPDGTHAYELIKTPVILVSNRGETQQLEIKGL